MDLKNSKTNENLKTAFIGEAMARCKYMYYAEKAREEGMENLALAYEKASRNEQEHGKLWFERYHGILSKDEKYLNSAQNCKCLYLKNNQATTEELKFVIFIFLGIASIIGGVLFFMSGYYVALLAFIGLCVAAGYQKLSISGKGEIAIFIAYGPLLYEGTYYVMTGKFSFDVLFLSIACVFMTITVLYAHMLMDYDGDESSHKITLCRKFKNKTSALKFILVFYLLGFLNISAFAILTRNYYYFLSFLTLPLIIDLYKSLNAFNHDKMNIPQIKFWHYPLDGWEKIKNTQDAPFYFRFFYVRNILIWFLLLICIGIIL